MTILVQNECALWTISAVLRQTGFSVSRAFSVGHMDDFYQTLGLSPSATSEQIKEAYRGLVRLHHPDANPERREASEALMKAVLTAYATLSNPEKRAIYDRNANLRAYERIESGKDAVRVTHHAPTYGNVQTPTSLVGKVRVALGDSPEAFARKLGLSEPSLADFEARDAVPQTPIQLRTFTHLVESAARQLESGGKLGEAADLRAMLERKKANRNFFR